MNTNFYQDMNFYYTEVGTVLEYNSGTSKAKIYIDIISPGISGGKPFKTEYNKKSASKIINKGARSGVGKYTLSNYVELKVPKSVLSDTTSKSLSKGDKVLVTFVGGELNVPRIIGFFKEG